MRLLPSPTESKTQFVTRHLGGLAAIEDSHLRAVIWSRKLVPPLRGELAEMGQRQEVIRFVSLPDDPLERVRQQLRLAGLKAPFLSLDMALLVTVFGELSGAKRVAAHLQMGRSKRDERAEGKGLRMVAAYEADRPGREVQRLGSYVAVIREEWFCDHPLAEPGSKGLYLCLESAEGSGGR